MDWSTTKPTNPGWYWIRDARRYGVAYVRQDTAFDAQKYLWAIALYPNHGMVSAQLNTWNDDEWAGPIDSPFMVARLCKWESGCNIPMQQAIEDPASLCLWHQACLKTGNPQETARDVAQFDAWLRALQLVEPVPEPWGKPAEVLFSVTLGKRVVES